ncbi:MAG: hypothetical protein ACRD5G_06910 [Candidatus Acidiferrales bacterium]
MTIAAGLKFENGVLLCADSQFSYGGVCKTPGHKLMSADLAPLQVQLGFAFAGDIPKSKTAMRNIINSCIDAARDCGEGLTGEILFDAIEEAQQKTYQSVFKHPRYLGGDGPDYWLLICGWLKQEGVALFVTDEDSVTPVDQFDCKGTGDYLFRYLVQSIFKPDLEIQKAVVLATHALQEIKNYDPNVGFNSEFMIFDSTSNRFSGIAGYDIDHVERFGTVLRRSMYGLLYKMADLRESDESIQKAKQLFQDNLTNLRRSYSEDKKYRNQMMRLLEYLSQPGEKKITIQFKKSGEGTP